MSGDRQPGAVPLRFGDSGVLRGALGQEMRPEVLERLGAELGRLGEVGLGHYGGHGAHMLAQAAARGVAGVGGRVCSHAMECAAQAAWLAEQCAQPASLFVEQEGERICLHFFDREGMAVGRARAEGLERAAAEELPAAAHVRAAGTRAQLAPADYARGAARQGALYRALARRPRVAVPGNTAADRAIRQALEELGCRVCPQWERGIPAFFGSHGGFRLSAQDESGAMHSSQQLLTMVALVEMENGGGRLAVPEQASAAVDLVAAGFGGRVLRLEQDGEPALRLYRALPWLRHAAFAAVRLCARMAATGERLEQLSAKTPRFASWCREVPLTAPQQQVLAALTAHDRTRPAGDGVRLRSGSGWVYLAPVERRSALRVVAEGADLELAAELCDVYALRAARVDREICRRQRRGQTK